MNQEDKAPVINILIAEDDDAAAHLIKTNLRRAGLEAEYFRTKNGEETLQFLELGKIQFHDKLVIFLDIRMPKMDGVEVLKNIKSSPDLKNMPVIILTTTDDPREIEECYSLGCNCYITKPVDFIKFTETLKRLGLFIIVIRVAKV